MKWPIWTRITGITLLASLALIACTGTKKVSYTSPAGVTSEKMYFKWPDGTANLQGVLLKPGSFDKVVIIVPANGPNVMYAQAELIDSLLSAGVAVLSYDERGAGNSTGTYTGASYFDLAADVTLVARNLRRALGPGIQIGAIGIGNGGWKSLVAAHYDKRLEFLVLIGTPGVSGDAWIEDQVRLSPKAWRLKKETPDKTLEYYKEIHRILKRRQSEQDQLEQMNEFMDKLKLSKKKRKKLTDPLYRSLVNLSTDQFAGKNQAPALVILETTDPVTLVEVNESAWQAVAERTGVIDLADSRTIIWQGKEIHDPALIRSIEIWILGLSVNR